MIRFALVALAGAALFGCAGAGSSTPSMTTAGFAFPPAGFYEFCARERALCAAKGAGRSMDLTSAREAELRSVNAHVNKRIRQVNDVPGGKGDVWRVPISAGDCEDMAIKKKQLLLAKGWPASTLLLTVVRPRFGEEGHTVLTARTSKGDFILDSLAPSVKLWSATSYRYYARQSQERHGEWEQILKAS